MFKCVCLLLFSCVLVYPIDLYDFNSFRSFYVTINGTNSTLYDVLLGTVQGSVLGPVLYALFIAPSFDLEEMSAFADDNFTIRWHRDLEVAKLRLEMSLAVIISWLSKSGLKVNANKTEICHFSRNDHLPINISINASSSIFEQIEKKRKVFECK